MLQIGFCMHANRTAPDDAAHTIQLTNLLLDRAGPTRVVHPDVLGWGKTVRSRIESAVQCGIRNPLFPEHAIDRILLIFYVASFEVVQRGFEETPHSGGVSSRIKSAVGLRVPFAKPLALENQFASEGVDVAQKLCRVEGRKKLHIHVGYNEGFSLGRLTAKSNGMADLGTIGLLPLFAHIGTI